MKMKKVIAVAMLSTIITLSGCSTDINESDIKEISETAEKIGEEVVDQTVNIANSEEEHVLMVKNGHANSYPNITYADAFEGFFAYPTWKYFVGTEEGPDEDGDGLPDYTKENVDVVEFTGYCTYQETEVKALIQFTLDQEGGTFTATYLSFNGVPQNNLMLYTILEKAFEEAAGTTETIENSDTVTEGTDETYTQNDSETSLYEEMFRDKEQIAAEEISGAYVGSNSAGCSISMYSSVEDVAVGYIEWTYNDYSYSGEMIPVDTNVYKVTTKDGDEILIGVYTDNGKIGLDLYLNEERIDYLIMQEHYEA